MRSATMADPVRYPTAGDDPDADGGDGAMTGTPRWVKAFGVVVVIVLVVVGFVLLTGGHRGPSRHTQAPVLEQPTALVVSSGRATPSSG
jgi:hypothetical protein